ncbi:MAG TPA: hypothetical protein DEP69_02785, partial [Acidimicrobiaceae bacterium]|nr:hypothetical protein [Acidimicrobiaceae bacterium]
QYVLGRWGFRGLDLAVDRRALIPRPETETLAGAVIDWLRGEVRSRRAGGTAGGTASLQVADLGTGCGAVALAIAQEVPEATVHAADCSADALELAGENLAGLGRAGARVTIARGDWFEAIDPTLDERLDAVVSNPPYVADDEPLPPEVSDWEPHLALRAGEDGLACLGLLVSGARARLRPGGLLALECAPDQTAALVALASARGYDDVEVLDDLAGRPRVVTAHRPAADPPAHQLLSAVRAVRAGGFVVAPTDTVCGVLADYANTAALRRVYAAKRRPESMPVPVLVSGIDQAEQLVMLGDEALEMAQRYWPGALTLVAPRRAAADVGGDGAAAGSTLGVRVPDLGWLRWLASETGPLTGTSANCHGADTLSEAAAAARSLAKPAAHVMDGSAPGGAASTVVDVCGRRPTVLREGALCSADLARQ